MAQRTKIVFGGVEASVGLQKMSTSPRDARHDVRWMNDRGDLIPSPHETPPAEDDAPDLVEQMKQYVAPPEASPLAAPLPPGAEAALSQGREQIRSEIVAANEPAAPVARHGVALEDGTFVDLTERLNTIDQNCKLDGVQVACTIPSAAVPRERVREAHWIESGDPTSARVLALLWHGLNEQKRVAVVRWTKKTNQALGVIAARHLGKKRALVLLECEWHANMRAPSTKATQPIEAETSEAERGAALRLVEAFAAPVEVMDELRDERAALRAELLTAARAGEHEQVDEPAAPEAPSPAEDLVRQWADAAEAREAVRA